MSKRLAILKDTSKYALASYISQFIGIANSIFLRRLLGPASMGIWSVLQVVLNYCGHASLGTSKALAREYPYHRGRGDHEKAEDLKNLTVTFSLMMSVVPALLIAGYVIFKKDLNPALRTGLIFLIFYLFLQRFYDIVLTLLRSDKKFGILSGVLILNAGGTLIISLLLVWLWNLNGLFAGTAAVTLICLGFIYSTHRYSFRWFWDKKQLWQELKFGIPLVAVSFLYELLKGLDKLLIAAALGFHEVGIYSIAMMVNSYVASAPMMFSHVWYPNLIEEYGRKGSLGGIRHYLDVPVFALSVLIPTIGAFAIYIMPILVAWVLPKFAGGLPSMSIYLIGTFFIILAQFSQNFLVAINKYLISLPILGLSVAVNYGMNKWVLGAGWGLTGVASATSFSFLLYGYFSYVACLIMINNESVREGSEKRDLKAFLTPLAVPFYLFSIIFLIDRIHMPNMIFEAMLKIVLYLAGASPLIWQAEKKAGLFKHLLSTLKK